MYLAFSGECHFVHWWYTFADCARMNWGHSHLFSGDWTTAVDIYHEVGANEELSDIYIAVVCEGMCHVMNRDLEAAEERMKAAGKMAAKSAQNKEFKRLADRYSDGTARYQLSFFEWKAFLRSFGSVELEESLLEHLETIQEHNGLLIEQSSSGGGWFGFKGSGKDPAKDDMKMSYLFSKATILDHLKRHSEAIECYEEVVKMTPENDSQKLAYWFAAFYLAQLKYHTGAHQEAVSVLEKIKSQCNNHRLVFSAKRALARVASGDIEIK